MADSNKDHDTHLIPISKILNHFEYVQCTTSQSNTIDPAIKDAVSSFSHDPVADGIANLASSVITKLLGESLGSGTIVSQSLLE